MCWTSRDERRTADEERKEREENARVFDRETEEVLADETLVEETERELVRS